MGTSRPWTAPVELHAPKSVILRQPPPPPVVLTLEERPAAATPSETEAHGPRTPSTPTTHPQPRNPSDDRVEPIPTPPTDTNRPLRWLLGVTAILLIAVTAQNTYLFLHQQWQTHTLLGAFFSLILLALGGAALALAGREFFRLRQLRTLTTLRQEAQHLITCQTFGSGQAWVHRITQLYRDREDMTPCLQTFHHHVDDYLGDKEILDLFSTHVLTPLDAQAYQVIVRHASAAALITAISPLAWLDALLFLWRNVWMVRDIAEVYGARPGAAGSLVLLRHATRGMMGAGLTDVLANTVSDSAGDSVATLVLAKAGQGVANGLFLARIGLQTMHHCRPMPFRTEDKPGLGRVRKALQQALKKSVGHPEQVSNAL